MIGKALLLVGYLLISASAAAQEEKSATAEQAQSLQVAADVTLNGDVNPLDVAEQFPDGVLYIDLRTPQEEGVEETRDEALRLGMRYENIPVDGPDIVASQVAELESLLKMRGHFQHTVLRCGSGNRAGMMWGATRIDAGEDPDQVMKQLQTIITKPAVEQALRSYTGNTNH
jgi:protein tyrosine phosphatase (PTP) superfamily phosphohydrolase (DUF442 family)